VWRAIFAINLPLGLISIYLLLAKLPADKPTEKRSLDLGGAALATLAFGLLAYGLTAMNAEGGGMLSTPAIVAGVVLLFVFIAYERWQRDPMIDLGLFRIRAFAGANLATFFL
ncbi:MAG: MFS transporter, partial [Mesorhizobium sp.]